MASAQTRESANDFDPGTNGLCPNFSFTVPDHSPASTYSAPEDISASDFEFANPVLPGFECSTPQVRTSDMWALGKSIIPNSSVLAGKNFPNPGLLQKDEIKNRGTKAAEFLSPSSNFRDGKSNGSFWKEIFRFKKPHFLRRSSSAGKSEKPVCPVWNPWLGRSESDPKTISNPETLSGWSKKDSSKLGKYRKLSDSRTIRGFQEGRMSPARPRFGDTIAMGGVFGADLGPSKLQRSMKQAVRKEDLQKYLKRPSSHQFCQ